MSRFLDLLSRHPLIALHLVAALLALLIGAVVMARRKGTSSHRLLGWSWTLLMGVVAVSSVFIRDTHLPNIAGYTPIHFFTITTAITLPVGIGRIRRGDVAGHRQVMRNLFMGACVTAGMFTLLPGRLLGTLLWKDWLGLVA
jgi:uncharacterized membrane protein